MMKEVYELGIAYIKAYYKIEKIYSEIDLNKYKLSWEMKDVVSQRGIAGNARWEYQAIDCLMIDEEISKLFNPVKKVIEDWNNENLTKAILKSIAEENYHIRFADRDFADKKIRFTKEVAESVVGQNLMNTINKYQS